jgi:hypothetical protein
MGLARIFFHCVRSAPQMHAERAGMEAGIHEEAGQGVRRDGLAVDGGDEHALVDGVVHALLAARAEKTR